MSTTETRAQVIERNGDFAKIRARGTVYACMRTLGKWEAVSTESQRFPIGLRINARSLAGLVRKLGSDRDESPKGVRIDHRGVLVRVGGGK